MGRKRISKEGMAKKKENKPRYIADRIVGLRKYLNLTQADIGQLLGVTSQAVYSSEKDNGALLMEVIILFATNFGINPAWILLKTNKNVEKYIGNDVVKISEKAITQIELINKIGSLTVKLESCKSERESLEMKIKELKSEKKKK
jgi:DNA-binding XRE family transcriptional regulator